MRTRERERWKQGGTDKGGSGRDGKVRVWWWWWWWVWCVCVGGGGVEGARDLETERD